MQAEEIRTKFIKFFQNKGHVEIPPAPLVPPNDPTTLFTGSGMQQLVPFLKGEPHPMGTRLVDAQPCFRAEDIEEVGDGRHTTFFEMLGNWGLGDYFKKQQLPWFFEFLTQEVGLQSDHLYVTVFAGDANAKRDEESINIWQEIFETTLPARKGTTGFDPTIKIYTYGADKNWWSRAGAPASMPAGEIGGPDSEVFYDFNLPHHPSFGKVCHLNCDCGRFLEIGNSVFMQYEKQADGSLKPLPQKNVDFGGGLERIAAASQASPDIFQTDLFLPLIKAIEEVTGSHYAGAYKSPMQVISDHLRAATNMVAQGLEPSNKTQGYILRRLLRRAAIKMYRLTDGRTPISAIQTVARTVIKTYEKEYKDIETKRQRVDIIFQQEMEKFTKTLDRGLQQIEKQADRVDAKFAFDLFQTYGFPFEITQELLAQKGKKIEKAEFETEFKKHQERSRTAAHGLFKGGLADQTQDTTKLHTATHLLHQALRLVVGEHVRQEGSNITAERLRFDFSHPRALTAGQITKIQALVNQKIKADIPVIKTIEEKNKAIHSGALGFFKETYPKKVSVYTIGNDIEDNWFSKELCGGPHVKSTGEIGGIQIIKEQAVQSGIRRIYAKLHPPS